MRELDQALFLRAVREAAAGFAEGVLLGCVVTRGGDSLSYGGSSQPAIEPIAHEPQRNQSPISDPPSAMAAEPPVDPFELQRAIDAITNKLPDDMYDPQDPTENSPRWMA